jgi:hypothetical protein
LFWARAGIAVNRTSRNRGTAVESGFLILIPQVLKSGLKRRAGTELPRKTVVCCRKLSLLSQRTKFLV